MKLPVTWLRQTGGKLRRDGDAVANVQPRHAIAERGKLYGALDSSLSKSCRSDRAAGVFLTIKTEGTDGENDEDDRG
ncbi:MULTISPECIES: hypothetical protein [unclassified Bradyrhizobium]|uniref:hypothetical protein n=1 Tax=unclassified Bradyrhizobium TaxID=2631580 RepID=UPI002915ECAF|nr:MULTISPECIES: hypothetical protein [unclassified Bradyrhizobium]